MPNRLIHVATLAVSTMACMAILGIVAAACDDAILGERSGDDAGAPDVGSTATATGDGSTTGDGGGCESPPSVPVCDGGGETPMALRNDAGCIAAYACLVGCVANSGGTCGTSAQCASRRWSVSNFDCRLEGEDRGCCRSCPAIAAPPAGFCDSGSPIEVKEGDCVVNFACP